MKFWKLVSYTIIVTTFLAATAGAATAGGKNVIQSIRQLDLSLQQAYDDAITKSLAFAPTGRTIFLLRGDAQTKAQEVLDQMTEFYELPRYELPTIRFRPVLHSKAAGTASNCEDAIIDGSYEISLNEILFLRNYDAFMKWVIPHEVAHIVTCMLGGFDQTVDEPLQQAAHGEEWLQVMRDMGFEHPEQLRWHNFDMSPVAEYRTEIRKRMKSALFSSENP